MDIWMSRLEGARFLDLFGGTGAVGLEALSRGADSLVILESDPKVLRQLEVSCRSLKVEQVEIVAARLPQDLARPAASLTRPFNLAFADPPYAFDAYDELIQRVGMILTPTGELVVEHHRSSEPPTSSGDLARVDQRLYGDSCLTFYRWREQSQG